MPHKPGRLSLKRQKRFDIDYQNQSSIQASRQVSLIGGEAPSYPNLTINVDGCAKVNPGPAGAGDLSRDCNGEQVAGLVENIGVPSGMKGN